MFVLLLFAMTLLNKNPALNSALNRKGFFLFLVIILLGNFVDNCVLGE